jgi:excisionase family DNA binding protein
MPLKKSTTDLSNSNFAKRKIGDLAVSEFALLFIKLQSDAIQEALIKILPQTDPDENVYMTTKEVAEMLGFSRQTIQEKKSRLLLEFYGEGRIQRTTLAAVKRYLKKFGTPLSKLKKVRQQKRRRTDSSTPLIN